MRHIITSSEAYLNFNCSFKYRVLPNGLMIFLDTLIFLLFPMSCHTVLGRLSLILVYYFDV